MGLNPQADFYVPDSTSLPAAMKRTTHLWVGAHQDDGELAGLHGILECYRSRTKWFSCVTCTDGGKIKEIRQQEQRDAGDLGKYGSVIQLNYLSSTIKDSKDKKVIRDLTEIVQRTTPSIIYTHNIADKHDTHVAVALSLVGALREMHPKYHPQKLYGVEIWRGLDWLPDDKKVVLDVSKNERLAKKLIQAHTSQVEGKRYDLANLGRQRANATYLNTHQTDDMKRVMYAMDLTPIIRGNHPFSLEAFVTGHALAFEASLRTKIMKYQKG